MAGGSDGVDGAETELLDADDRRRTQSPAASTSPAAGAAAEDVDASLVDGKHVDDRGAVRSANHCNSARSAHVSRGVPRHKSEKLSTLFRRDVLLHLHSNSQVFSLTSHDRPMFCFLVADFFLGHLLVGPLITVCWRAAWIGFNQLVDDYLFRFNPAAGTAVCVVIGVAATNALCAFVAPYLVLWEEALRRSSRAAAERKRQVANAAQYFAVSRVYTLVSFLSCMILWKGWWDVCEREGFDVDTGLFMFVIGLMSLVGLRSSRTAVAFPLVFSTDRKRDYFVRHMFNGKISVREF